MDNILEDIQYNIKVLQIMAENNDCGNYINYDDFLLRQIEIVGIISSAVRCKYISYEQSYEYQKQIINIKFRQAPLC